jgi:hypothetical protein
MEEVEHKREQLDRERYDDFIDRLKSHGVA